MKLTGLEIEPADVIAFLALLASLASWWHSSRIEARIRRQSDARANFDATILAPYTARLDLLEQVLFKLDTICGTSQSDIERASKLSDLQKNEHGQWFMSCITFLDAHDPNQVDLMQSELHTYWDQMSDYVNELSQVITLERLTSLRRQAGAWGNRFLVKERAQMQKLRSII